jgi:hypothetical protein
VWTAETKELVEMHVTKNRSLGATIAVGAVVAFVGCANASPDGDAGAGKETPTVVGDHAVNWDDPIVLGVPMASTDALSESLSFQAVIPTPLGDPLSVMVNDPASFTRADRGFAVQYQTADKGRFWLMEEPSDMTQKDLEAIPAQCDPAQGCQGSWSLTTLNDGTVGLVIDGPASVGVVWLRDGIYIDVMGPSGSFTTDEAVKMANAVAAKA